MKKSILVMTALLGLTVLESQAQTGTQPAATQQDKKAKPTPEEQAERQTKKATEELSLTPDQQKQFKAFALERASTVQPLHEKARATQDKDERKKIHQESKAANDKFDTSVKGILTPEQLTKWEARKAEMKEKRKVHKVERREKQGQ